MREDEPMSMLTMSSKGQIVLPAALRRRLGMGAGARIEAVEEADGVKLRVLREVTRTHVTDLAGMIRAPRFGAPRRLADFDAAAILRETRGKP